MAVAVVWEQELGRLNSVVVDRHGLALHPARAAEFGVHPDIIFVRHGGWSLGAPWPLADHAYILWPLDWRYFVVRGEDLRRSTLRVRNYVKHERRQLWQQFQKSKQPSNASKV